MGPNVCYLLALGVMAYFIHLTPVRSQCTTKYCTDDANDENYLTAVVARLLDEVDREKQRSLEILDSMEQLYQQFNRTVEQLRLDHQRSTEQLQQQFNDSMVEQRKRLTRLEEALPTHTESRCYLLRIVIESILVF